jgi:hypothetical protein
MCEAKFYAVEYGDAEGSKHRTILMNLGGLWYHASNGEAWANNVKPASEWLTKQLDAQLKAAAAGSKDEAPKTDAVDVISTKVTK